ncbi:hypothetical protein C4556_03735 [Candidatus Parcubacteria bacterium]|nr:MAG: hypothetical protein C4556_03735 [Candidatus Parcubacteria bacterium]
MGATGRFDMERLTPRFLAKTYHEGDALVRGENMNRHGVPADPYAYLACLKSRDAGWCEIALAYVREQRQGNGVGRLLMAELLSRKSGVRYFTISQDPAYQEIARRHGFCPVTRLVMSNVEDWAERVGLNIPNGRQRLPETALRDGLPRLNGGRWLFIR